jgi:acetoacetyl-CoA synthetase
MSVRDGDILTRPTAEAMTDSRVGRYLSWLAEQHGRTFASYDELWHWSVTDLDGFWRSIWDYFEMESATPVGPVLGRRDMPGAEWFPGTTVNYVTQYLKAAQGRDDELAVIGESQTRDQVTYTFGELTELAGRIRAGLVRLGVTKGDRVVAVMPNIPETQAALLATASLGAIWSSAAPEFGPKAITDRFGQLDPKVLLTVDGYRYGDKDIDILDRVATIRSTIDSIDHVVGLSYNGRTVPDTTSWEDLVAEPGQLSPEPVPFDHPLYVLFSSGTTGLPKAIVHGHGGITIESLKNHTFSWDLGPGDRLMWFTTTAWMMWNALAATLLTGASIVCLDGNPMWPDLRGQWQLAERVKPTLMGMGPAYVMNCRKSGVNPGTEFDLSSLRMVAAAGSPLPTEGFVWLQEQFPNAPVNIGSGGTDVCTGLVQGYPIVPVYAGEMSAKCLGVSAYAYDDAGQPVVGELGELVITEPMPSMPVKFWGDDDHARYRSTYFEHFPGVMRFGDWIRFTEHGSSIITGRSDATLNRGGVRIGSAEIYRVVEQMPEIDDSLVVHLEDPDGGMGQLVLFVQAAAGVAVDDDLRAAVAKQLKTSLSPRHVPDTLLGVDGVPRNLTGKKLELPIKKILLGQDPDRVVSREAMANPESLDDYVGRLVTPS